MTMLFKECSPRHGIRSEEEDIVVAVDADNGRLLHYQHAHNGIALPLVCPRRPHHSHALPMPCLALLSLFFLF
jgi:hypothetical protein